MRTAINNIVRKTNQLYGQIVGGFRKAPTMQEIGLRTNRQLPARKTYASTSAVRQTLSATVPAYMYLQKEQQGVEEDDEQFKFIKEKVEAHPVIMFSKTTCRFCAMAKEVLDEVGVEYIVEELNERDDCSEIQDMLKKITGERSVPRVFINGKCIGGGSETWSLHNQGKLVPLLKEAGAQFIKIASKKVQ